jgi:hypothetical protein
MRRNLDFRLRKIFLAFPFARQPAFERVVFV